MANDRKRIKDLNVSLEGANGLLQDIATKLSEIGNIKPFEFKANGIDELADKASVLNTQLSKNLASRLNAIAKGAEGLDSAATVLAKTLGVQLFSAINNLGKAFVALTIDSVTDSFSLLWKGLTKIYDLFERSTKATGQFNLSMGATTENLDSARGAGWKLEGQMRALTGGELGVGLKMFEETAHAVGFVGENYNQLTIDATKAGRALGIGGQSAGEIARSFTLMGDESKNTTKNLANVSRAADLAGVPVADFGKEINAAKGFMVSFGKKGQDVFLKSAAFAKKLGVSLQGLERFTEMSDNFDSAATSMAKLNTVFGTSVNSLSMMLEQDPSKRLEMVRGEMKSQGKTWENMNRQERKFFAQTMQLSDEEAAGIMSSNMTLAEFQKKKERADKKKISDEELIRKGLAKTSETLLNFGQIMDQITAAFKDIYTPILKAIGLLDGVDEHGKKLKTFAQHVQDVVGRFEHFFKLLQKNDKIKNFISKIATDIGGLLSAFTSDGPESEKTMQKIVDAIGVGAEAVGKLYEDGKKVVQTIFTEKNLGYALSFFEFVAEHIEGIIIGFTALQGIIGGVSVVKGISAMVGLITGTSGLMGAFSSLAPALLGATAALAAAGAAGYALGTAFNWLLENVKVKGKSIQDIWIDTTIAWQENTNKFWKDSWELVKTILRKLIPDVFSDWTPDFLKARSSKDIAKENAIATTGSGSIEEMIGKLKGGGLSSKELAGIGTRMATMTDADVKTILGEAGVKDTEDMLQKLRSGATAKYETGYKNMYAAAREGMEGQTPSQVVKNPVSPANYANKPVAVPAGGNSNINISLQVDGKEMAKTTVQHLIPNMVSGS